jgi:N utilization substance protein B
MSGVSKFARDERTTARLAAVQALYQMELSGAGADAVVAEFVDHRFERVQDEVGEEPGGGLGPADEAFFTAIVRGVVTDQAAIDRAIAKRLASGWKLERLDATVRAALRAGAWELHHREDVPTEVVIDEYVELAKGFTDEGGFINGALDAIARDVRKPA